MAGQRYKALVIVESPAKARKIGEYLGKDYVVMASMGHIRDLPSGAAEVPAELKKESWSTLGVNIESGFEPLYVIPKEKKKTVKELKDALKECQELILATDEDREGESIGWHLMKVLEPKVPVQRMVFSEITKSAIQEAIRKTRKLDENLVEAQETRRVVDRLYGYRLSPLLWKKVAPRLSAGRVQSVAVRVLVSREVERLAFRKGSYWDLKATLEAGGGSSFDAMIYSVDGQRIAQGRDFDESTGKLKADSQVRLLDEAEANKLREKLTAAKDWHVSNLETRMQTRRPYPPFTTSTLQQEANRKLGLSARETMQVAQRLYEDGHITYMRTDSVSLSQEAIDAARGCVNSRYGNDFLSPQPRQFTTKSKAAQEAHEAIRPAGTEMKTADEIGLGGRESALYSLIWKRTVASQMADAQLRFQTASIAAADAEFRATGRHIEFAGFFRAYVEGTDDPEAALDDTESALPPLTEGQKLSARDVQSLMHETKPPARFTEATLVKTLEDEGIGRPSTYASIIGTIQDRGYVRKQGNQLIPTFTAMAVTKLLEKNFSRLVDLRFTAQMEQDLDDIASGQADRLPYLQQFYTGNDGLDVQVREKEEGIDPRDACTLDLAGLNSKVRVGKFGAFFESTYEGEPVTATIPEDVAPADLTNELATQLIERKKQGPQSLGIDPESNLQIYVLVGPFGPYLQLGERQEDKKPRRVSIPKTRDVSTLTHADALAYLSLPRTVGVHPETGKVVKAGVGMYGPYVQHEKTYKSLTKDDDVLTVDLNRAVELISQAKVRQPVVPLKDLGAHPSDGEPVQIFEGRYGPYVKHGKVNATLPKDRELDSISLPEAVQLLEERAAKGGGGRGKRGAKKTAATKATRKTVAADGEATATVKKKAAKKTTKKATKKKSS